MVHSNKTLVIVLLGVFSLTSSAQVENSDKYHRNSLYSILLKHPEKEYCKEMIEAFKKIPIPERYNNHDLKYKVLSAPIMRHYTKDEIEGAYKDAIERLLIKNKIGGRLVEKWFNRNSSTGAFDMGLVKERGFYDASILDVNMANLSARGNAILSDAGEKLLSHTFVLVNDIRYADGEVIKDAVGGGLFAATYLANYLSAGLAGTILSGVSEVGGHLKNIASLKVIVTSYLFKLEWNNRIANNFYSTLWIDKDSLNNERKLSWNSSMGNFKLYYLGCASVFSGKTALGGVKDEKDMFLKVCTRAIDKSISELQKNFDEFKVFVPLASTEPLCAYVGLKEGVNENSKYEVLLKTVDEEGFTAYQHVGEIKPVKDKIWDNRFMANFDHEKGSELEYTIFEVISGKGFLPGMLIREIE